METCYHNQQEFIAEKFWILGLNKPEFLMLEYIGFIVK